MRRALWVVLAVLGGCGKSDPVDGDVAPVLASFSATPSMVEAGVATEVSWTWSYANAPTPAPSCTIDGGVGAVVSGAVTTVTLTSSGTFLLTCANSKGTATASATVTARARAAPVLSAFAASPATVVAGAPTEVTFTFEYAGAPWPLPTCAVTPDVGPAMSGTSAILTLTGDTAYTLTCTNEEGTDTAELILPVTVAPALAAFAASPSSVTSDTPTDVTFTWTYANAPTPAPTCTIDHGVGSVASGAVTSLSLATDTLFRLTCSNAAGEDTVELTLPVTVAPVLAGFGASPSSVALDTPTNVIFSWTYSNTPVPAPNCTIDPGVGPVANGAVKSVSLATDTLFTLTCGNTVGSDVAQTTIAAVVPPRIASFGASPTVLGVNVPTNVTWTWTFSDAPTPAPTCTIDGGVGTIASGSTTSVTLSHARTYRLTCAVTGGTAEATATLGVDECAAGLDDCGPRAHCVDTVESFGCGCDPGYAGDGNVCSALGCDSDPGLCDANASCTITGDGAACVCADGYVGDGRTCERLRLAFVTSTTTRGHLSASLGWAGMTGLAAGDAECQARAAAAGLPGSYVAWLSDSTSDAYCRVHGLAGKKSARCGQATLPVAAGPWVRTDHLPFAPVIDRLLAPNYVAYYPAAADESGVEIGVDDDVFTGTGPTGVMRLRGSNPPCLDWSSAAATEKAMRGFVYGGAFLGTDDDFLGTTCENFARLRCLEIGSGPALPPRHRDGKKVFVTSVAGTGALGTWADAGGLAGIAAGDAICRARARAAGLQNSERFAALLSESASTTAYGRVTGNGPWARVDGVIVASDKADLFDNALRAPIAVTETGGYLDANFVWTGSTIGGGFTSSDCSNWTLGTNGGSGRIGRTDSAYGWIAFATDGTLVESHQWNSTCNSQHHLICFEN